MTTIDSIVRGAFRLVKEQPRAVAVWALIYFGVGIVNLFAMRPFFDLQAAMVGGSKVLPDMNAFWGGMRWFLIVQLGLILLYVIVLTASQRAVLRPDEGGPGFLRLGMDELRMIGLTIIFILLFYGGLAGVILLFALLVAGAGIGAGAGVLLGFLVIVPALCLALWAWIRLSLAFPLTLLRRRIVIGESWRLTRGRFWTLFTAYLALFIIVIVLSLVVSSVSSAPYMADMMRSGSNPEGMMTAAQNQVDRMSHLNVITLIGLVLNGIVGGLWVALLGGATATAAKDLAGDETLAREFE